MCVIIHKSMHHLVISDQFHTLIIVVCVCVSVCVIIHKSMHHLVISDQFYTLIIVVCVCV